MTETTMDRSIAYAMKMVGCSDFALKPEQLACVTHLCEGQDVFLWLPTGSGKSLCYEVLPFAIGDKIGRSDSVAIVFSPLISPSSKPEIQECTAGAYLGGVLRVLEHPPQL